MHYVKAGEQHIYIVFTVNIRDLSKASQLEYHKGRNKIWGHPFQYQVGNGLGLFLSFTYL
jgi:hypothetical protein